MKHSARQVQTTPILRGMAREDGRDDLLIEARNLEARSFPNGAHVAEVG